MLLVVFGAGASYDSVPHHPPLASGAADELRPPLANELFADRPQFVEAMKQFPDCLALIPRLRKHGVVVEQELAILQEQAKTFPPALREIAAIRYYLHFILQQCQESWRRFHFGITNHAALLREIERWRVETGESVCLVTFNYDTMIEEALSQVLHLDRRDIDDYISREYPLVKLHGSANWGREVDGFVQPQDFRAQTLIDNVAVLDITRRYRLVTGYPMLTEGSPHEGFKIVFPALSIPVENKDDFECPESHLKALEARLPAVDKILAIGWRAKEAEFLKMLRSGLLPGKQQLMIVSGSEEGVSETCKNLWSAAGLSPSVVAREATGFSGLTSHLGSLESFLRRTR